MTKQEVGFVSGLDPAHISRMEGGKQRPMLDTIYRVAIALNCSTDYLLGLSDKQDLCIETVDKASQKD
jgi:transcriptional regulator with XRE-family HTH domain